MAELIEKIESRFKEVTGLTHLDLSISHFERGDNQQQKTTKDEFKNWGYVCTPLWLVDEMIEPQMDSLTLTSKTCDACSGCGQFSVRMMRKIYTKYVNLGVDKAKMDKWIECWLNKLHYFTEFQFSNVAKLVYIFGPNINVYAGDSLNLKYSSDEDKGILIFKDDVKKWINIGNLDSKIEPIKDDLNKLVTLFAAIEKKVMKPNEESKKGKTK